MSGTSELPKTPGEDRMSSPTEITRDSTEIPTSSQTREMVTQTASSWTTELTHTSTPEELSLNRDTTAGLSDATTSSSPEQSTIGFFSSSPTTPPGLSPSSVSSHTPTAKEITTVSSSSYKKTSTEITSTDQSQTLAAASHSTRDWDMSATASAPSTLPTTSQTLPHSHTTLQSTSSPEVLSSTPTPPVPHISSTGSLTPPGPRVSPSPAPSSPASITTLLTSTLQDTTNEMDPGSTPVSTLTPSQTTNGQHISATSWVSSGLHTSPTSSDTAVSTVQDSSSIPQTQFTISAPSEFAETTAEMSTPSTTGDTRGSTPAHSSAKTTEMDTQTASSRTQALTYTSTTEELSSALDTTAGISEDTTSSSPKLSSAGFFSSTPRLPPSLAPSTASPQTSTDSSSASRSKLTMSGTSELPETPAEDRTPSPAEITRDSTQIPTSSQTREMVTQTASSWTTALTHTSTSEEPSSVMDTTAGIYDATTSSSPELSTEGFSSAPRLSPTFAPSTVSDHTPTGRENSLISLSSYTTAPTEITSTVQNQGLVSASHSNQTQDSSSMAPAPSTLPTASQTPPHSHRTLQSSSSPEVLSSTQTPAGPQLSSIGVLTSSKPTASLSAHSSAPSITPLLTSTLHDTTEQMDTGSTPVSNLTSTQTTSGQDISATSWVSSGLHTSPTSSDTAVSTVEHSTSIPQTHFTISATSESPETTPEMRTSSTTGDTRGTTPGQSSAKTTEMDTQTDFSQTQTLSHSSTPAQPSSALDTTAGLSDTTTSFSPELPSSGFFSSTPLLPLSLAPSIALPQTPTDFSSVPQTMLTMSTSSGIPETPAEERTPSTSEVTRVSTQIPTSSQTTEISKTTSSSTLELIHSITPAQPSSALDTTAGHSDAATSSSSEHFRADFSVPTLSASLAPYTDSAQRTTSVKITSVPSSPYKTASAEITNTVHTQNSAAASHSSSPWDMLATAPATSTLPTASQTLPHSYTTLQSSSTPEVRSSTPTPDGPHLSSTGVLTPSKPTASLSAPSSAPSITPLLTSTLHDTTEQMDTGSTPDTTERMDTGLTPVSTLTPKFTETAAEMSTPSTTGDTTDSTTGQSSAKTTEIDTQTASSRNQALAQTSTTEEPSSALGTTAGVSEDTTSSSPKLSTLAEITTTISTQLPASASHSSHAWDTSATATATSALPTASQTLPHSYTTLQSSSSPEVLSSTPTPAAPHLSSTGAIKSARPTASPSPAPSSPASITPLLTSTLQNTTEQMDTGSTPVSTLTPSQTTGGQHISATSEVFSSLHTSPTSSDITGSTVEHSSSIPPTQFMISAISELPETTPAMRTSSTTRDARGSTPGQSSTKTTEMDTQTASSRTQALTHTSTTEEPSSALDTTAGVSDATTSSSPELSSADFSSATRLPPRLIPSTVTAHRTTGVEIASMSSVPYKAASAELTTTVHARIPASASHSTGTWDSSSMVPATSIFTTAPQTLPHSHSTLQSTSSPEVLSSTPTPAGPQRSSTPAGLTASPSPAPSSLASTSPLLTSTLHDTTQGMNTGSTPVSTLNPSQTTGGQEISATSWVSSGLHSSPASSDTAVSTVEHSSSLPQTYFTTSASSELPVTTAEERMPSTTGVSIVSTQIPTSSQTREMVTKTASSWTTELTHSSTPEEPSSALETTAGLSDATTSSSPELSTAGFFSSAPKLPPNHPQSTVSANRTTGMEITSVSSSPYKTASAEITTTVHSQIPASASHSTSTWDTSAMVPVTSILPTASQTLPHSHSTLQSSSSPEVLSSTQTPDGPHLTSSGALTPASLPASPSTAPSSLASMSPLLTSTLYDATKGMDTGSTPVSTLNPTHTTSEQQISATSWVSSGLHTSPAPSDTAVSTLEHSSSLLKTFFTTWASSELPVTSAKEKTPSTTGVSTVSTQVPTSSQTREMATQTASSWATALTHTSTSEEPSSALDTIAGLSDATTSSSPEQSSTGFFSSAQKLPPSLTPSTVSAHRTTGMEITSMSSVPYKSNSAEITTTVHTQPLATALSTTDASDMSSMAPVTSILPTPSQTLTHSHSTLQSSSSPEGLSSTPTPAGPQLKSTGPLTPAGQTASPSPAPTSPASITPFFTSTLQVTTEQMDTGSIPVSTWTARPTKNGQHISATSWVSSGLHTSPTTSDTAVHTEEDSNSLPNTYFTTSASSELPVTTAEDRTTSITGDITVSTKIPTSSQTREMVTQTPSSWTTELTHISTPEEPSSNMDTTAGLSDATTSSSPEQSSTGFFSTAPKLPSNLPSSTVMAHRTTEWEKSVISSSSYMPALAEITTTISTQLPASASHSTHTWDTSATSSATSLLPTASQTLPHSHNTLQSTSSPEVLSSTQTPAVSYLSSIPVGPTDSPSPAPSSPETITPLLTSTLHDTTQGMHTGPTPVSTLTKRQMTNGQNISSASWISSGLHKSPASSDSTVSTLEHSSSVPKIHFTPSASSELPVTTTEERTPSTPGVITVSTQIPTSTKTREMATQTASSWTTALTQTSTPEEPSSNMDTIAGLSDATTSSSPAQSSTGFFSAPTLPPSIPPSTVMAHRTTEWVKSVISSSSYMPALAETTTTISTQFPASASHSTHAWDTAAMASATSILPTASQTLPHSHSTMQESSSPEVLSSTPTPAVSHLSSTLVGPTDSPSPAPSSPGTITPLLTSTLHDTTQGMHTGSTPVSTLTERQMTNGQNISSASWISSGLHKSPASSDTTVSTLEDSSSVPKIHFTPLASSELPVTTAEERMLSTPGVSTVSTQIPTSSQTREMATQTASSWTTALTHTSTPEQPSSTLDTTAGLSDATTSLSSEKPTVSHLSSTPVGPTDSPSPAPSSPGTITPLLTSTLHDTTQEKDTGSTPTLPHSHNTLQSSSSPEVLSSTPTPAVSHLSSTPAGPTDSPSPAPSSPGTITPLFTSTLQDTTEQMDTGSTPVSTLTPSQTTRGQDITSASWVSSGLLHTSPASSDTAVSSVEDSSSVPKIHFTPLASSELPVTTAEERTPSTPGVITVSTQIPTSSQTREMATQTASSWTAELTHSSTPEESSSSLDTTAGLSDATTSLYSEQSSSGFSSSSPMLPPSLTLSTVTPHRPTGLEKTSVSFFPYKTASAEITTTVHTENPASASQSTGTWDSLSMAPATSTLPTASQTLPHSHSTLQSSSSPEVLSSKPTPAGPHLTSTGTLTPTGPTVSPSPAPSSPESITPLLTSTLYDATEGMDTGSTPVSTLTLSQTTGEQHISATSWVSSGLHTSPASSDTAVSTVEHSSSIPQNQFTVSATSEPPETKAEERTPSTTGVNTVSIQIPTSSQTREMATQTASSWTTALTHTSTPEEPSSNMDTTAGIYDATTSSSPEQSSTGFFSAPTLPPSIPPSTVMAHRTTEWEKNVISSSSYMPALAEITTTIPTQLPASASHSTHAWDTAAMASATSILPTASQTLPHSHSTLQSSSSPEVLSSTPTPAVSHLSSTLVGPTVSPSPAPSSPGTITPLLTSTLHNTTQGLDTGSTPVTIEQMDTGSTPVSTWTASHISATSWVSSGLRTSPTSSDTAVHTVEDSSSLPETYFATSASSELPVTTAEERTPSITGVIRVSTQIPTSSKTREMVTQTASSWTTELTHTSISEEHSSNMDTTAGIYDATTSSSPEQSNSPSPAPSSPGTITPLLTSTLQDTTQEKDTGSTP
ncbi:PREDICTED: mucin-2-like, partial [Dipodomys ordii]|uniref:Mucin-2-like n=1 Tax=Dipodomys ordii TaxID=10020 RepID=A0A1S3GTW6_DIPOR